MKSFAILLGGAVSLIGMTALASDDSKYWEQRQVAPDQAPPPPPPAPAADPYSYDAAHPQDKQDMVAADEAGKKLVGISVEAGGGVGGFLDSRIAGVTSAQGQWTARMIFGTRSHFGGEAAYVGAAQTVNTLGISPNATLVGNGAEGAFRLNVLTGMWQPYAIAGLGWVHYSLGNAQITTSDAQQNGDVATFPVGVGMAWRMKGLVLDTRFSFHPATSSALIRDTNLSTWDLNARAGFEF